MYVDDDRVCPFSAFEFAKTVSSWEARQWMQAASVRQGKRAGLAELPPGEAGDMLRLSENGPGGSYCRSEIACQDPPNP